ncbi:MAG TPA: PilZ domain-containing protein [Anaeromyxobacteraceae bacterium]|nr:PilZ domain-containing protein [Anaeromyxobacteraceae bacterium]
METRRERRRDQRFRIEQAVTLVRGRRSSPARTADVGFRGVRLRTDAPPPLRELLLLRVDLPTGGEPLEVHGMAVWGGDRGGDAAEPGVGVQFFAVPHDSQQRWNEFVRQVARTGPEPVPTPEPSPGTAAAPSRRLHERVVARLEVRLDGAAGPRTAVTRYLSRRGAFLETSLRVKVGARLRLQLLHPATGEPLAIDAVVRHRGKRAAQGGIGVEFAGVDERAMDQLRDWVLAALDRPDPDDEVVAAAPPHRKAPVEEDLFAGVDLAE